MIEFVKLISVRPNTDYRLQLVFSNGARGERDFEQLVQEHSPLIEPLRDQKFFARAYIDCGALAWPNGFDLDPTQLHKEMQDADALETVNA